MLIAGQTSVAAGATNTNVLSGSVYEYLPWDASLEFGLVSNAAGDHQVTVLSGSDVLMEETGVSRQNRVPIYPDDFALSDVAAAGERIVIKARNTGAGAATLFWAVKLTPV